MAIPMGGGQSFSGDKLAYIESKLTEKNLIRISVLVYFILIVPMAMYKQPQDVVDMVISSLGGGIMLRGVDVIFGKIFGKGNNGVVSATPFVFPVVFITFTGVIFDILAIVNFSINMYFGPAFMLTIIALMARAVVVIQLGKVARMILDPSFEPADLVREQTVLLRTEQPPPTFTPFFGQGQRLTEGGQD